MHIVLIIRRDKLYQYNLWEQSFYVGGWVVCRLEVDFQPAHNLATNVERLLPEVVLIQFVSPDDEHYVHETCREL